MSELLLYIHVKQRAHPPQNQTVLWLSSSAFIFLTDIALKALTTNEHNEYSAATFAIYCQNDYLDHVKTKAIYTKKKTRNPFLGILRKGEVVARPREPQTLDTFHSSPQRSRRAWVNLSLIQSTKAPKHKKCPEMSKRISRTDST